jgi:hypothetical protein
MRWFRQRQPDTPAAAPAGDPFEAVPFRPVDVEVRRDREGNLHLRRYEQLTGVRARVAAWLHYDCSRKLALDRHGTLYYSLADGTRTLRAIAERLAEESGQPMPSVEQGVILFTKKLMTMNLLALKVPARRAGSRP